MPAPNPITGATIITVGSVTTLTDTTLGGTWSSSNTAIATINAGTGLVTAIAPGICQIIYTVGSNSTSVSITVNAVSSLTNGINFNAVYPGILQNRVLWKSQGILSASQRYYEGFHALNDTAILDDLRPNDGSTLTEYLENQQQAVCMEVLNAVYNAPQVIDKPKLAFWRDDMPLPIQLVANQDQFVGLYFYVGKGEHAVKLNNLYLFFNGAATFNLYLYNDFFLKPVMTIPVTVANYEETIINLGETLILNNLVPNSYNGGRWYLGYWQQDLPEGVQAIYYPVGYNSFSPLTVLAFSSTEWEGAPHGDNEGRNFNRNTIGANNLMYGMNAQISTYRDASNSIVQQAHLLDEVIGLTMTVKSIEAMIFSYQSNDTQRVVQGIPSLQKLYGELNGYKVDAESPYIMGVKDKLNRAINTVKNGFQAKITLSIG